MATLKYGQSNVGILRGQVSILFNGVFHKVLFHGESLESFINQPLYSDQQNLEILRCFALAKIRIVKRNMF